MTVTADKTALDVIANETGTRCDGRKRTRNSLVSTQSNVGTGARRGDFVSSTREHLWLGPPGVAQVVDSIATRIGRRTGRGM